MEMKFKKRNFNKIKLQIKINYALRAVKSQILKKKNKKTANKIWSIDLMKLQALKWAVIPKAVTVPNDHRLLHHGIKASDMDDPEYFISERYITLFTICVCLAGQINKLNGIFDN